MHTSQNLPPFNTKPQPKGQVCILQGKFSIYKKFIFKINAGPCSILTQEINRMRCFLKTKHNKTQYKCDEHEESSSGLSSQSTLQMLQFDNSLVIRNLYLAIVLVNSEPIWTYRFKCWSMGIAGFKGPEVKLLVGGKTGRTAPVASNCRV